MWLSTGRPAAPQSPATGAELSPDSLHRMDWKEERGKGCVYMFDACWCGIHTRGTLTPGLRDKYNAQISNIWIQPSMNTLHHHPHHPHTDIYSQKITSAKSQDLIFIGFEKVFGILSDTRRNGHCVYNFFVVILEQNLE